MNKVSTKPRGFWEGTNWYVPYALYEPKKKNAIIGKTKGESNHLTPNIVHMYIFLYKLFLYSIVLPYFGQLYICETIKSKLQTCI